MEKEYKSGLGENSELPPELNKWNWGAFCLNWIWGIGNSTYIALLMIVPVVNIVMMFMLGVKGNKWAWQNRIWRDVEHFRSVQRKWAKAGFALFFIVFPLFFLFIGSTLKGEAFNMAMSEINKNAEAVEYLGSPIEAGFLVMGEITQDIGGLGKAELSFSVNGSKDSANAIVSATKEQGIWQLNQVVVYNNTPQVQIVIVNNAQ